MRESNTLRSRTIGDDFGNWFGQENEEGQEDVTPQGGAVCFIFLPKSFSCPTIYRRSLDMANARVDGAAVLHDWGRRRQLVWAGKCGGAGRWDAAVGQCVLFFCPSHVPARRFIVVRWTWRTRESKEMWRCAIGGDVGNYFGQENEGGQEDGTPQWGSVFYFSAQVMFLPGDLSSFVGHGERESRRSCGVALLVATSAISLGRKMWRGRKIGCRRVGQCVLSFCPNPCSCPPFHRRLLDMANARVEGAAAMHDWWQRRQLVWAGK